MNIKKRKKFYIITAVLLIIMSAAFFIFRRPNARLINREGDSVVLRFNTPDGFERLLAPEGSFGRFLQELPLLPDGSPVRYYNGRIKFNSRHEGVLDYELPGIDLEQCADVVMHLYAEYLYSQKRYDEIGFHFVNGFYCDFATWSEGNRPNINGEEVSWLKSAQPDNSRESFEKYLRIVYAYASTLSLEKEMTPVEPEELAVGDVFIKGGSPGHVVIVVDMAVNRETGEKRFILLHGNMPSQQAHIIKNTFEPQISPWFSDSFPQKKLVLATWECPLANIKRFA